MYIIILAINCHSLFCLWVVSPLQCRSSILVFILFIYVIYVTNHQDHCKCKRQMSVILCSHGLLDWFNKTILFYSILFYNRTDHLLRHRFNECGPTWLWWCSNTEKLGTRFWRTARDQPSDQQVKMFKCYYPDGGEWLSPISSCQLNLITFTFVLAYSGLPVLFQSSLV